MAGSLRKAKSELPSIYSRFYLLKEHIISLIMIIKH